MVESTVTLNQTLGGKALSSSVNPATPTMSTMSTIPEHSSIRCFSIGMIMRYFSAISPGAQNYGGTVCSRRYISTTSNSVEGPTILWHLPDVANMGCRTVPERMRLKDFEDTAKSPLRFFEARALEAVQGPRYRTS